MLLNITAGDSLSLHEVDEASQIAKEKTDPQANIIVGQVIDPNLKDKLVVTVIATGFEQQEPKATLQPTIRPAIVERTNSVMTSTPHPVLAAVQATPAPDEDSELDRPTFMRRMESKHRVSNQGNLLVDEDWDVPTFLRRRGN
jgi:cell division protein FtsZ